MRSGDAHLKPGRLLGGIATLSRNTQRVESRKPGFQPPATTTQPGGSKAGRLANQQGEAMSTETVHPMVAKAARGLFVAQFGDGPHDDPDWQAERPNMIREAQAALTDCVALECLEALEKARDALDAGSRRLPQLSIPRDSAAATIAKVYGSAPE
jgi:hypothetical protein